MSAQDQAGKPTQPLNPDFRHRLDDEYDVTCPGHLLEAVDMMILRSKSTLSIIADLHIENHINQINPENIYWTLNSVMRELDDIYAVVKAYGHATKQKGDA